MIKINNINKNDLLFFINVLEKYLEVLNVHTTSNEDYRIQKSISKTIIKTVKGKIKHLPLQKVSFLWQFNEYQAIVFSNALMCFKGSAAVNKTDKYTANLFLDNLNHQLKYYEKAS